MQRPPTPWGNAIVLTSFVVLCLLMLCHAKSLRRYERPRNVSMSKHHLKSKNKTENAVKREWETGGHYHRAVPEHFAMAEHGPEIHLDIDECGSRVDTHPAALSVDTSTDPHEHCCHHCHHHCDCCCCDDCGGECCCDKRSLDRGEHHNDYDDHQDPDSHLIQHTLDTKGLTENQDESCVDVGEGGCPNRGEMEQCYGGVCRDHVAHFGKLHSFPFQPFQYSEHAARKPLHSVYDLAPNHPIPHLLAESPATADGSNGFSHSTQDSHVGHTTGETRGNIGTDTPLQRHVSGGNDSPSNVDESAPKLVTFGRNNEGIAFKNEETNHNSGAARQLTQEDIALKRSSVKNKKPLKRSKRC